MLKKAEIVAYLQSKKYFDLYTDWRDLQLGATLVQKGKPISFYTRELNFA